VTIVAEAQKVQTIADGLSTGVFIMGPEAGMTLIEKLPDVEGVIVSFKERSAGIVGPEGPSDDTGRSRRMAP